MSGKHMDIHWVRNQVLDQVQAVGSSGQTTASSQLGTEAFRILMSTVDTEVAYTELLELLGFDRVELAGTLISAREQIQRTEHDKHTSKRRRREQLRIQGNPALCGGSSKRGSDLPSPHPPSAAAYSSPGRGPAQASGSVYEPSNKQLQRQQQQQHQNMPNNLFSAAAHNMNKFVYIQQKMSSVDFVSRLAEVRQKTASSVLDFPFPMGRTRLLSSHHTAGGRGGGVVYWMSREQRVQDNWALLYSQKLALEQKSPLYVCFCLVPTFLQATHRQYGFMMKGLQEVEQELSSLGIVFRLLLGPAATELPHYVNQQNVSTVVTDFSPLRVPRLWVNDVKDKLPKHVPFYQVDAHNIVPCWEASDQAEEAAYLMKLKLHKHVHRYMTEYPPVIQHPYTADTQAQLTDWVTADRTLQIDRSVGEVDWATPGTTGGLKVLEEFIKYRLPAYKADRNIPTKDAVSHLSPWFHFGQVSVQRALLVTNQYEHEQKQNVDKFFHETLIWRELAENFCYHEPNYDNWDGCPEWAKKTWEEHLNDKRQYIYSRDQLEMAQTHDDLWNAAQLQLSQDGKMHGFLRMYWAKKIMEWTETPQRALQDAIYLNDKYSLDGRDPNGYGGCMWSICGVHDHEFQERKVTGKVRCMTYFACTRKFDVPEFIRRYKKVKGPMDKFVQGTCKSK